MNNVWRWAAIIVIVLCMTSSAVLFYVYRDIKNTAKEIYTPITNDLALPDKREEDVDITKRKEPISILILGVDEQDGDIGRSDTMIVMTVNPTLLTTKMLSIPRDTYTEIVGKGYKDKINHAYSFGGAEMSMKTVENLLAIPIDYVAQINMEGFVDVIEIVGGITVDNTLDFHYEEEYFPLGKLELDGERALKYVRMRYDDPTGDFGRQNRQKQVIQGVLKESMSLNTVWNHKSIFKTLEDNVEINVVFDDLLNIRKNYGNSFKAIEQLHMSNGEGTIMNGIYYYVLNDNELTNIQKTLKQHLEI